MKKSSLNNLPISHLSYLVLNEDVVGGTKIEAEDELKVRMAGSNISYLDILDFDYQCYEERGYNLNNYLFCAKPDIQTLMELYYKECFDDIFQKNNLVFSERHLCNDMTTKSGFFLKFCEMELKRLKNVIENDDLDFYKQQCLNTFYNALLSRTIYAKEKKEAVETKSNARVEQLNSFLFGYYDFDVELTRNEQSINEKIIEKDYKRLAPQRMLLQSELKKGGIIDYETPSMKKVYKKAKENIGVHKFF